VRPRLFLACLLSVGLLCSGCATYNRQGLEPSVAEQIEKAMVRSEFRLGTKCGKEILALDPEQVDRSGRPRGALAGPGAPNHQHSCGIYPVHRRMISFSEFSSAWVIRGQHHQSGTRHLTPLAVMKAARR